MGTELEKLARRCTKCHSEDGGEGFKEVYRRFNPKGNGLTSEQIEILFDESFGLPREAIDKIGGSDLYQIAACLELDAYSLRMLIKYLSGKKTPSGHLQKDLARAAGWLLDARRLERTRPGDTNTERTQDMAKFLLDKVAGDPSPEKEEVRTMAKTTRKKKGDLTTRRRGGVEDSVSSKLARCKTVAEMVEMAIKAGVDPARARKHKNAKNNGLARMSLGNLMRGAAARKSRNGSSKTKPKTAPKTKRKS